MKTLYEILGVEVDASKMDIKRAYFKLAKIHHPDKGGDSEKFSGIHRAYQVLMDDEKRTVYDETGTISEDDINIMGFAISMITQVFEKWLKQRLEGYTTKPFLKYIQNDLIKSRMKIKQGISEIVKDKKKLKKYEGYASKDSSGMNIFEHVIERIKKDFSERKAQLEMEMSRIEFVEKEIEKYTFRKMDDDESDQKSERLNKSPDAEAIRKMFRMHFI